MMYTMAATSEGTVPRDIYKEALGTINEAWGAFLLSGPDAVRQTLLEALNMYAKSDPPSCTPVPRDVFRAFSYSSPDSVKVVILGQDPYPGADNGGQILHADGLCFSSRAATTPQSLRNVFECIVRSQFINAEGLKRSVNTLDHWAEQGVLMLNTKLTTVRGQTNKHKFWLPFTSAVIKHLAERRAKNPLIFMLWGRDAQEYERLIGARTAHVIMESAHPSPMAQNGLPDVAKFYNCNHFIRANQLIRASGAAQIQWSPAINITMYLVLPVADAIVGRWALVVPEARFKFARTAHPSDAMYQALNKIRGLLSRGPFKAIVFVYGGATVLFQDSQIAMHRLQAPIAAMKDALELQKNSDS